MSQKFGFACNDSDDLGVHPEKGKINKR